MKINWIRELFSFSKKERTGIVSLLLIIFILIVVRKLIPRFVPVNTTDFSKWESEVSLYLANTKKQVTEERPPHFAVFNPNEVDSARLAEMGVPSNVNHNWLKYIKKGGRFRDRKDVKKIFGMTDDLFGQLDNYIVIPKTNIPKEQSVRNAFAVKPVYEVKRDTNLRQIYRKSKKNYAGVLELNSADSAHLVEIPGIGPVFASRIIRYRNLLGGYFSVAQLREVYGLREENFEAVAKYFRADTSSLKTFNINFSTIRELGRHPYVGFITARKIFNLRDKIGKFLSARDLSAVVSSDSLKRLIPYVKFTQ